METLTQQEAIEYYKIKLGLSNEFTITECTGDANTCPNDECMICSIRDCPHNEALHYHHDGCPACIFYDENM